MPMTQNYALLHKPSHENSQLTSIGMSRAQNRFAFSVGTIAAAFATVASFVALSVALPTVANAADKAAPKAAQAPLAPAGAPETSKLDKTDEKTKGAKSKTPAAGDKKVTTVVIETSLGNIEVELNSEKAPVSSANFLKYVDKKHYDGLIFHRVIPNFMIQGGGMDEKLGEKKNDAPIKNEAGNGLNNDRGTIAMARTQVVNSATSQFFINTKDNGFLNHKSDDPQEFGYAVFGKVTSGLDTVEKIEKVPTGSQNSMGDVPKTPVVIKSIRRK